MFERKANLGDGMTQQDFDTASFSRGFGSFETLTESFEGGVQDSAFLGFDIRNTAAKFAEGPDPTPLTEQQYKDGPSFRKEIPYDPRLTVQRAAVFAEFVDQRIIRETKLNNTPGFALKLLGGIAGQALDPINYIPVFGQFTRVAAVARFGNIAGRIAVAGGDAAINTALAGMLTIDARSAQGFELTTEDFVFEIATAALIGGVFGTVGGALASRNARITKSALAEAELSQESINDAVGSIFETGDVNISPETTARMVAAADKYNPAATQDIPGRLVGQGPERFEGQRIQTDTAAAPDVRVADVDIPGLAKAAETANTASAARRSAPEAFVEADASKRLISTYRAWIQEIKDSTTGAKLIDIDAKIEAKDSARADAISNNRRTGKLTKELNELVAERKKIIKASNETPDVKELRALIAAEDIKLRNNAVEISAALRKAELGVEGRAATVDQIRRDLLDTTDTPAIPLNRATTPEFNTPEAIRAAAVQRALRAPKLDGTSPAAFDQPVPGNEAITNVKSDTTPSKLAEELEVDVEGGGFRELDAFEVMKNQDRLTPGEIKNFENATEVVERTKNYAEALRQSAFCEVG